MGGTISNFKKIYTADYSKEGYDDGIKAGKEGSPKEHSGALKLHPANFVWRYNGAHDSYCQSYNKGYLDGQRVDHNIYSSSTGGGMTELERQYQHLEEVKKMVYQHRRELEDACAKYAKQVFAMEQAGFVDDYTEPLKEKLAHLEQKKEEMIEELNRQMQIVEQFQQSLHNMIMEAKSSSY